MAGMDGKGPENRGKLTGRGLGHCQDLPEEEALARLGTGMGRRRKAGGGKGQGKRLKSGLI